MSLVNAFGGLSGRASRSDAPVTATSTPSPGAVAFADAVATVPRDMPAATGAEKESAESPRADLLDALAGDGAVAVAVEPLADTPPSADVSSFLDALPFDEAMAFRAAAPAGAMSAGSTSDVTSPNSATSLDSALPVDGAASSDTAPSNGITATQPSLLSATAALAASSGVPDPSGSPASSTGSATSKMSAHAASSPIGAVLSSAESRATTTAATEVAPEHASEVHSPDAHALETQGRAVPIAIDAAASAHSPSAGASRLDADGTSAVSPSERMMPAGVASPTSPTSVASAPPVVVAASRPALMPQIATPVLSLAQAADGDHQLTLTVSPENLGPVTVRAHIAGGSIRIELHAPNDLGRDAIRSILADLRRDLAVAAPNATLALSTHDGPSSSTGQQNAGQQGSGQQGSGQPGPGGQQNAGGPGHNSATGQQNNGSPHGDRAQERGGAATRTIIPGAEPDTIPTTFTTPHGGIDVYA